MLRQSFLFASTTALVLSSFSPAIAQVSDFTLEPSDSSQLLLANRFAENLKQNRGELMDKLNLSNSQKQQIQGIRQRYSSQMNTLTSQMRTARATMQNLAQSNASRSQLERQYRTVSNLREDIADLKFRQMMDIRDVLTVSQRQEMAEYLEAKKKVGSWFGDR
ncbi:Spy/CpxP family protein refolding chaperone [[Limnothrix rosea] IAM M-220]|uniref:Spy/CpxP family protein refolding chaperone n=1 Tax=[Limnothrix rosea] IAM M-220 TaxID=454133 RepID=UPI0009653BBB|nr:Spy/CpxP family protein refolding chaperone [[Limnothrix rosea] IAM M-220]OKH14165.1 hypothetical protein NIES208_14395 [[Limnothrix rosea] IAM M-220]